MAKMHLIYHYQDNRPYTIADPRLEERQICLHSNPICLKYVSEIENSGDEISQHFEGSIHSKKLQKKCVHI